MDTKIIDNYYFEMFSPEGEEECRNIVKKILSKVGGEKRVTKEELLSFVVEQYKSVEEKHSEIFDTEPSGHITYLTNLICKEFGYSYEFSRYELC